MYLWRKLGISSWPTFAIIGPNGKLLAQISGEGRKKVLVNGVTSSLVCMYFLLFFVFLSIAR